MNLLSESQVRELRNDILAVAILSVCLTVGLVYIGLAFIANGLGI